MSTAELLTEVEEPARRMVLPQVAMPLPARRCDRVTPPVLTLAAGTAAAGGLWAGGCSAWSVVALCLSVFAVAGVVAEQIRQFVRDRLTDDFAIAAAGLLGSPRPSRKLVRVTRWTQWWPGVPRRVRVRYLPTVAVGELAWTTDLLAVAQRCFGRQYRVSRRRPYRRLLWLTAVPEGPAAQVLAVRPLQRRAERAIADLLGPTAKVVSLKWDEDDDQALVEFTAKHDVGAKLAAAGYRRRVESVVSTMLPGRWRAIWNLQQDRVTFKLRTEFPGIVFLPLLRRPAEENLLASYNDLTISYAVDEDGNEITWRPAVDPHHMIIGATGSGKTVVMRANIVTFCEHGWPVWIADAKAVEFRGLQDWPNVQVVASSTAQIVSVIHKAWELMEYRYALMDEGRADVTDFEPLLLVIDEFPDFVEAVMQWYSEVKTKGMPTKPPVIGRLKSLARKARTCRIHIVAGLQRPDAEYFGGGEARDNFRQRTSLGRLSMHGAQMMWGDPATGTTIPRGVRGRATTVNNEGVPIEAQTYYIPDPFTVREPGADADILAAHRPAEVRHPRLLIPAPKRGVDLDTSLPEELTYAEFAYVDWVMAEDYPGIDPVVVRANATPIGQAETTPMSVVGIRRPSHPTQPRPARTADEASTVQTRVTTPPETSTEAASTEAASTEAASMNASPTVVPRPRRLELVPPPTVEDEYSFDTFDGYGESTQIRPTHLVIGDLICVDDTTDLWAVVDEEPEPDPEDPECVFISWRTDDNDSGCFTLPGDDLISVRHSIDPAHHAEEN